MKKYITIGLKNIWRNKRRSIFVVLMLIVAISLFILFEGFLEDSQRGWLKAIIHAQTSHLQITKKGFYERPMGSSITKEDLIDPQKIEEMLKKDTEVIANTKRLAFGGMIATEDKMTIFSAFGIDTLWEYEVFSFLTEVEKGGILEPKDTDVCVIGCGLAEYLKVGIGDKVILWTKTQDGAMNAIEVKIKGIFRSGKKEVDKMCLSVPLSCAQKLLNTDKITNICILLKDIKNVDKWKERFQNSLDDKELEVHPWHKLAPIFKQVMAMNRFQYSLIEFIVLLLIALGIANVMLLSVFERTREIGALSAFGLKKIEIIRLFLAEGFALGLIGAIVGVIMGIIITISLWYIGIPFQPPGVERIVYIRPIVCIDKVILGFVLGIVVAVIGGVYPAYYASRIKPVEALKFL